MNRNLEGTRHLPLHHYNLQSILSPFFIVYMIPRRYMVYGFYADLIHFAITYLIDWFIIYPLSSQGTKS